MKAYFYTTLSLLLVVSILQTMAQKRDKAIFVEPKNEFLDSIKEESDNFARKEIQPQKSFRVDFSLINHPTSPDEFTKYWANAPISQGLSGMCWCFSATSFFETEVNRLHKRQIKLSELYTVYWEYVEKARRFVRERGNSEFGEGSESNAVPRIWKQYGIVPAESYTGLKPGQKFHDHGKMFSEMNTYLQSLKSSNFWNEEQILSNIKSILNYYIGEPPTSVTLSGKQMSPKEYLEKIVQLKLDDYVEVMSIMQQPYYQWAEYEVPDNWWHSKEYFNIPLDVYMTSLKKAIRDGYTVCIGGDVSEVGYEGHAGVGIIPTFDIPTEYIDENARQFRFSNRTSTDDHGIHLIGYKEQDGTDWYLIKDSGAGSRNNNHPGYYFYREDYVKLKMLGFMVHRDMVEDILKMAVK